MPPRHTYWTIILEGKPTAFRAHTPEELIPTLKQLQSRHPDAVMKWFARGRLWHTPEEARLAATMRPESDRRSPAWRPGGEHRDPRERFKVPRDEKRRRFARKLHASRPPADGERPPRGDRPVKPPAPTPPARERGDRPIEAARPRKPPFRPRAAGASARPRPHDRGKPAGGGRGKPPGGGRGGGGRGR